MISRSDPPLPGVAPASGASPEIFDSRAPQRSKPITVFLFDDHPVVAMGVRIELSVDERFRFVGHATTVEEGLERARSADVDAVVLDLVFGGSVRLDAVRLIRGMLSRAAIVIFSALSARVYAADAERLGADAYVTKDFEIAHLASVVESAYAARDHLLAQPVAPLLLIPEKSFIVEGVHLTPREAQVASRLGRGLSIADIAAELAVSRRTVSVHRDSLRRKMNCGSSRELVAHLVRIDAALG